MKNRFVLKTSHRPAGDQPRAIKKLFAGLVRGEKHQTLLGVTGSGKTFTAANVIEKVQKPTLVIAHNKTLAAQLAQEYRDFFPDNAVHYFVSYYDYYQPEAYMPITDTYIEKEAMINEEIDRLRHATTQSLLTRNDVIVVASVSCIYGLGSPAEYEKVHIKITNGMRVSRSELIRKLVRVHFERTNADLTPGQFRVIGNSIEIMPVNERVIYRLIITGHRVSSILKIDAITRRILEDTEALFLYPAKHFITPTDERKRAARDIKQELTRRLVVLKKEGKILEAERLKRRTNHDLALIREIGYCNGIENYSRHFDAREPGEPPYTLLDYFDRSADKHLRASASNQRVSASSKNSSFLTIIDESHVTVPQIAGMYAGDRSRKKTLVEHGFRLPSAVDNRPLTFSEFEQKVGQVIYTSATPGEYEYEKSGKNIVEQIIRPTGLVDPMLEVRPIIGETSSRRMTPARPDGHRGAGGQNIRGRAQKVEGQIDDFINEAEKTVKRGMRVMVTTLTKKMAEDLSEYLKERGVKAEYVHSDVKTIDRITILTDFRKGKFDCLVGVNLLREGLDLPEVELVAILDADKEGFLRSETSLIQTIGRAARNVAGRVILYADMETGSMKKAIDETNRRRILQIAHNKKNHITPRTIQKNIKDITEELRSEHQRAVGTLLAIDKRLFEKNPKKLITEKERQMAEAVKMLDFETAALLRDEIKSLKTSLHLNYKQQIEESKSRS